MCPCIVCMWAVWVESVNALLLVITAAYFFMTTQHEKVQVVAKHNPTITTL